MLKPPTPKTLARYGLSLEAWQQIASRQGWVCAVCARLPKTERLVIDHEHVKGWRKMPPKERANYVRGLLCNRCNWQFLRRGMTIEIAQYIAMYLVNYRNSTVENQGSYQFPDTAKKAA